MNLAVLNGSALNGPAGAVSNLAPDLMAAAAARLLSWNGGALAAALGDSASTPKVWADGVMGSPGLPWVRVNEPLATREYSGDFNYIESGQLQIDVFAAGRLQARQLGWMVAGNVGSGAGALDDAPLVFAEGALMNLRLRRAFFAPEPGVAPAGPRLYHRVLIFDYRFSGQA